MRVINLCLAGAAVCLAAPSVSQPAYSVTAQLPAGDGGWDLASVDPSTHRLYVARTDGVTMVDLISGKSTDQFISGHRVHAAMVIPGTHDVLATNGETNDATLFDGLTGEVKATVRTGTKPDATAYDPATRTVWVMNPGSGDVTVLTPTAKVLATVPVGGSLELAAPDGRGHLFVNVEDKNELVVLDTRKRKVASRFPLKGCDGPTGIAYDPGANEIVSACANGVAVVSTPKGTQIAKLAIGTGADGAAFDAWRHLLLVPAGRDGNLTIIKLGANPAVVGQIATAVSARTIAIDPSTGIAYLPSAKLAAPVGNERPKPVPGSFRVLTLSPRN